MDEVLCIGFEAGGIIHFALQRFFHLLELCHTAESILFQIRIISGEEHAAQGADDVLLLLFAFSPELFLELFPGDVPSQNVDRDPVPLLCIDHMVLHPAKGRPGDAVLADLLGIIPGMGSFLIQMLRAHDFLKCLCILRMDGGFQSPVEILMITSRECILHGVVFVDQDPLALAVFQINGGHDAVSGLEDCSKLHIPKGKSMLLTHAPVHVLQRQDRIISGAVILSEIGDDRHIAVFVVFLTPPLTEHVGLMYGGIPDLAQAFQGEGPAETIPVRGMDLTDETGAHKLIPRESPGFPSSMRVSVLTYQIGLAGVQVDAVDPEVLGAQGTDDLLYADARLIQLQAFLQDIMDVLDIEENTLVAVRGAQIRYDLHQVPPEILLRAPAVAAGQNLQSCAERFLQMVRAGEGDKIVHIVRMDVSIVNELSQPAGKGIRTITDGSVPGADLHNLILVLGEIDPQNLMIGMADHLHMRRYRNDKSRDFMFPQGPDRRDIHHIAKWRIIAESPVFLPVSHGQEGAVHAGVVPHLMAGHTCVDMGRDLLNPPVVIQNPVTIFTDDKNAGRRYCM